MTQIIGSLDIRKYDARRWQKLRQTKYILDNGKWLITKKWFILDFGSVPRFLWSLYPPLCTEADHGYDFHDGGYGKNRDDSPYVEWSEPFNRKEIDAGMREIHLHCGVHEDAAAVIWRGVRKFASWSWLSEKEKAAKLKAQCERNSLDDGIRDL